MPAMNMVEALNKAFHEEMKKDKKVVVLGEDVGKDGGVFRVTDGLYKKFKDRVIDTPLAESGIIGSSVGLALSGLKPVAEIQFMGFLYPGFDQLISHASRYRNRTRGEYNCQMVVRVPYGGGIRALEHHAESTEAILAHTPGLKVVIPSTPYDAKGLLISSIRDPDPVIFLEPKKIYRSIKQEVPNKEFTVPLGKAEVRKEGSDVTIITWGSMTVPSLSAAARSKDISIEVIDLRTIVPFDIQTIINSVQKTGRVIIVHEAARTGGFGAEIVSQINEKALFSLEAPIERVTGFDTVFPLAKMENYYLPNIKRIEKAVQKVVSY
ncbi:MAG: alpha-ketoacid dehydrogenase subunit beta [Candidatus Nanoarchaeia archaeon]|nr:alpha-ketoacid dehydrogenase subunit beta [Candidatus Nanoarchaeia archaeon]